jgi:hypothetical protein
MNFEGTQACVGNKVCQAVGSFSECSAASAHAETCNGKDDDCDAEIDEDFITNGLYLHPEHCGQCGQSCDNIPPISNGEVGCLLIDGEPTCGLVKCDPGYHSVDGKTCIPGEIPLCQPCGDNSDCGGGVCTEIGSTKGCTRTCTDNNPCPAGSQCHDGLCAPPSGDCSCIVQTAGLKKSCTGDNEFGACSGLAVCDPELGWVDCDAPPAGPESCNELDDNCDGKVDEGFMDANGIYNHPEHCGSCGNSCESAIPNATSLCEDGVCVVDECDPGFIKSGPSGCQPATVNLCQPCEDGCGSVGVCAELDDGVCLSLCGSDSDCPASYSCKPWNDQMACYPDSGTCSCTPESVGQVRPCALTNVFGTCTGLESCDADLGWNGCTAKSAQAESCNGQDDNCDGSADEGLSGVGACTNKIAGIGECPGVQICVGAAGFKCDGPLPLPETCDGTDENCDGQADEDFKNPLTGMYESQEHCGACNNACDTAPANASPYCSSETAVPSCAWDCLDGWVNADKMEANGCECEILSNVDWPGGIDENCDGIDGEVDNAIFVSISGDDSNSGTQQSPVRTIAVGLLLAQQQKKRDIYLTGGTFAESVTVVQGIGIYGGYSEDFSNRDTATFESVIAGTGSGAAPGSVNAMNLPASSATLMPTVLNGLTIQGPIVTVPGKASYALYLRDCGSNLVVSQCWILGGVGGAGDGSESGKHGENGVAGEYGQDSHETSPPCTSSDIDPGGVGAIHFCGEVNTSGGTGGSNNCPDYNVNAGPQMCPPEPEQPNAVDTVGQPGQPGQAGEGAGGDPGHDSLITGIWDGEICQFKNKNCFSCKITLSDFDGKDGMPGEMGADGAPGNGCTQFMGVVQEGLWYGLPGGIGKAGKHGGGGGGGGAGGGVETHACSSQIVGANDVGGSGGGGGSGGCGGNGGDGGHSGGAAFSVFMVWTQAVTSVPQIVDNQVKPGLGGKGGDGGPGGTGGFAGSGGKGGSNGTGDPKTWCAHEGGYGGMGGHGGGGGGGGGGCGGPAVAFYASGVEPGQLATLKDANKVLGGGDGGAGGAGGPSKGNNGQPGSKGAVMSINF